MVNISQLLFRNIILGVKEDSTYPKITFTTGPSTTPPKRNGSQFNCNKYDFIILVRILKTYRRSYFCPLLNCKSHAQKIRNLLKSVDGMLKSEERHTLS